VFVDKQTRAVALEWLSRTRLDCNSDDYYRAIKILHDNNKCDQIAEFVGLNFDKIMFDSWVSKLNKNNKTDKIMNYYRYIKWFGLNVKRMMFDTALHMLPRNILLQACDWLEWNIIVPASLGNIIHYAFFHYCPEIFNDKCWNSRRARDVIDFTIKHFPTVITEYVTGFVYRDLELPFNYSERCIRLVIELAKDEFEEGEIYRVNMKIWRKKKVEMIKELNSELYSDVTIKTSLFARLRRRVGEHEGVVRARYDHVMWELRRRFGRRVKMPE
jgi:hypothetical protein